MRIAMLLIPILILFALLVIPKRQERSEFYAPSGGFDITSDLIDDPTEASENAPCFTDGDELIPIDSAIAFFMTGEPEYAEEAFHADTVKKESLLFLRSMILKAAEERFGEIDEISYKLISVSEIKETQSFHADSAVKLELEIKISAAKGEKTFSISPEVMLKDGRWYLEPFDPFVLMEALNKQP